MSKQETVSFYTQGCRLNQAETAMIEQGFEKLGFEIRPFSSGTDIVVVNTCTVTEKGDQDTRRLVNKINRANPYSHIALVGCQAQILKDELLKLTNVYWVIGNKEKMNLAQIIHANTKPNEPQILVSKMNKEPFTVEHAGIDRHHTRANLKIQDGCDFFCTFCVIPFARGPARSRVFSDILIEARQLVEAGHQELVLTGINLGTYTYENKSFLDVVDSLSEIHDLKRIRISSIEPTTIPESIFEKMNTNPKLCRYLHIPLQSGSNPILKAMNRKYDTASFLDFIIKAKTQVPDICVGTDVIVGFPGETQPLFNETEELLRAAPIDYFHVFSYSERKFARSKKLDHQVKPEHIKQRSQYLRQLSQRKKRLYYQQFLNSTQHVLVEQFKHGAYWGLTDHYLKVKLDSETNLINQIIPVRCDSIEDGHFVGIHC